MNEEMNIGVYHSIEKWWILVYINSASLIGKIELYWKKLIKLRKIGLLNMINPQVAKALPKSVKELTN